MLYLKRIIYPYEILKCRLSKQLITYGDYYYEDDEDGLIVKAEYYGELLKKRQEDPNFYDYSGYNLGLQKMAEYESQYAAETTYLNQTMFNRLVAKGGKPTYNG